jgi:hypothetical protein
MANSRIGTRMERVWSRLSRTGPKILPPSGNDNGVGICTSIDRCLISEGGAEIFTPDRSPSDSLFFVIRGQLSTRVALTQLTSAHQCCPELGLSYLRNVFPAYRSKSCGSNHSDVMIALALDTVSVSQIDQDAFNINQ